MREGAVEALPAVNEVPRAIRTRTLSVRGFDSQGLMLDASLTAGAQIETLIARLFGNLQIRYLHVHFAARGCFAAQVERV